MPSKDIKAKRKLFALEYIVDFNGTQAAIRAGYAKRSAKQQGSRLLTYDDVQDEIKKQIEARSTRTEITADRVIQEYAAVAFGNMKDAMEWGATAIKDDQGKVLGSMPYVVLKDSKDLPQDVSAAVAEVKVVSTQHGQTVALKMHNKLPALDALAKHTGVYNPEDEGEDAEPVKATFSIRPAIDEVQVTRGKKKETTKHD